MVNQSMRAWVTACDNILDDEYEEAFPFDFAGGGTRMRSVLTLLLADRVVTEFISRRLSAWRANGDLAANVGRISLRALAPSAAE